MDSYFIFYDMISESPEFEYDNISKETYAKVRMSLYRVNETDPKTTKIAERVEMINMDKILNKREYVRKIKMDAENDDSAILLFYLTGGDYYG